MPETIDDRRDNDALDKKKVMNMVRIEKNRKQRLPRLKINIRLWVLLAVFGLLYLCGGSFSSVIGAFLGYKVLRLVLRLFGLVANTVFTLISILVLLIIFSLITI